MPRDISSSSSEDDADIQPTKPPATQTENDKATRYQCPVDFVSFCHKPCSSTLTESLQKNKNELWLIKAPASFNPECFSGIKMPLSGLQTIKVPSTAEGAKTGSSQQIYSILASNYCTSELCLLTSNKQSDDMVFGPAFSGMLNVSESYGDSIANQAPQVIPAAPAPSIPPGLKQRFHPFGSKTPTLTCVAETETDGAAFGPSSATLRPLVVKRFIEDTWQQEEEEGGGGNQKKKKKKKKEKQIKTERPEEPLELAQVKKEVEAEILDDIMMELPLQESSVLEEKRKKKKKKKEREKEQEEVEDGVEPSVRVKMEVKSEPIDTLYGDAVEGSGKKKKKKKKSKSNDG